MNAREQLAAVADWLGWQEESLSFGLKNALDGLRLYDYAQAHPGLPEMADEWSPRHRVAALGYDPLALPESRDGRDVGDTGAARAAQAMRQARKLLDSVAYVARPGDARKVIATIDSVI